MKQQQYITKEEHRRCRKVMKTFRELFITEGSIVADVGKYGFIKMEHYEFPYGFDNFRFYTDSKTMFKELWMDWMYIHLIKMTEGTPISKLDYYDIFKALPEQKRNELLRKKKYFARRAGLLKHKKDCIMTDSRMPKIKRIYPRLPYCLLHT